MKKIAMKSNQNTGQMPVTRDNSAKTNSTHPHALHRSRMRERFLSAGAENLQDHELLELLLYYAIPRRDTNPVAHELLARFGSLDKLFSASVAELTQVGGIGENAAVLIKTVFECHRRINTACDPNETFHSFEQIGEYLVKLYTGVETERLMLILFDKKGRIDRSVVISEGTQELAPVKTKKIVASAVSSSAVYAALVHNHPSGTLAASYEDKSVTLEVGELLGSLDIRLIDHYIIADGNYIGVKHNCFEIGTRDKLDVPDIFERHL